MTRLDASASGLPFAIGLGRLLRVKPKPLHRSLSFWSGILVMSFLVWAWNDSTRHLTAMEGKLRGASILLTNHRQSMNAGFIDRPRPSASWDFARLPATEGDTPERDLSFEVVELDPNIHGKSGTLARIAIPHWLLLLFVAVLWSGLLIWRARCIRRARP